MNAVGALTLLFLLFAVISYSDGKYNNTVTHLEIAAFLGIISILLQKEEKKSNGFITWVINNVNSIKSGTAIYEGKPVTMTTEIVRFQACLSFIFFTTKSPSRFFIKGQDGIFPAGLAYTFVTFLLGWWGIPWGPIYTLETFYRNLRGGHKQVIGDLINEIEKASVVEDRQKEGTIHPT